MNGGLLTECIVPRVSTPITLSCDIDRALVPRALVPRALVAQGAPYEPDCALLRHLFERFAARASLGHPTDAEYEQRAE